MQGAGRRGGRRRGREEGEESEGGEWSRTRRGVLGFGDKRWKWRAMPLEKNNQGNDVIVYNHTAVVLHAAAVLFAPSLSCSRRRSFSDAWVVWMVDGWIPPLVTAARS